MTWSRQLFQFVLCGHPTPRCWTPQRQFARRSFRSRLRTLGTHYHLTLDTAVQWTPSNDTSRPIFSDSLNLTPPTPLYLRTLLRYTNTVIIILLYYYYYETQVWPQSWFEAPQSRSYRVWWDVKPDLYGLFHTFPQSQTVCLILFLSSNFMPCLGLCPELCAFDCTQNVGDRITESACIFTADTEY